MSFRSSHFVDVTAARAELEKLRALVDDIEMMLQGIGPSTSVLAKAPVLERWTVTRAQSVALAGWAINHPEASSSLAGWLTSPLVVENQEAGWIRTKSRFYSLGKKSDGLTDVWSDASPDILDGI